MTWRFDLLPANLPSGRRYVGWNLEATGKVPYIPNWCKRRASVGDPSTWGTFDDARAAVEDGKCDGAGLVLTGDLTVIDLDGCIDPRTRHLSAEATAIVATFQTYTEISQSQVGLHVMFTGALPPGRRRRAGLEVYDTLRFIALTGAHLATTPSTIQNCTATLTACYHQWFPPTPAVSPVLSVPALRLEDDDTALLEQAHQARNGAAFARLWAGDASAYPSPSEADAALCRHLAFWTQCDPVRIDRLFRQSGLYRDKWDAVRGTDTYGTKTIAYAITTTRTVYRPPAIRLDDLEVPMAHTAD